MSEAIEVEETDDDETEDAREEALADEEDEEIDGPAGVLSSLLGVEGTGSGVRDAEDTDFFAGVCGVRGGWELESVLAGV